MQVEISSSVLRIKASGSFVAYSPKDIPSADIDQKVVNGNGPGSNRQKNIYPPGSFRWYVVLNTTTGKVEIPMGQVEDHPTWTNTVEGARLALLELSPFIQNDPCCGSGEGEVTFLINGQEVGVFPVGAPASIQVERNDSETGTLVGGIWKVPDCVLPRVTVNGVDLGPATIPVMNILVQQGGVNTGTVDTNTGIVTVDECAPGGGSGNAQLVDVDGSPIGASIPVPAGPDTQITAPSGAVKTTDGSTPVLSVKSAGSENLPQSIFRFKDAADVQQDSGAFNTAYAAPYIRPDFVFPRGQLKNSLGVGLVGLYATAMDLALDSLPLIPDSAVAVNGAPFAILKATQALNLPVKDDAGTATGSKVGSDWVVVRGPMKFVIAKYSYTSVEWTITADEAGSYTAWTDDDASGTWTYSKNGGAFIAATGTVSFVIGDTVQCQRTINTAQGFRRWAH